MTVLTVKEALNRKEGSIEHHYLYVIQTGTVALYVGQSKNPLHRLREHVGIDGRHDESLLGELILYNLPSSLCWQVKLLTLSDCFTYVKQAFSFYRSFDWYIHPRDRKYAVDTAEIALIRHVKPCLNVRQNTNETPLPETIIDPYKISSRPPHPRPRSYLIQLLKEAQIRAMQDNAL